MASGFPPICGDRNIAMGKNCRTHLLGLLLWMAASGGFACSVPVFRYALELWPSDPYTIYLMHDGSQPEQINKAEAFLEPYAKLDALDTMRINMNDPRVGEAIKRRGIIPAGPLPRIVAILPRAYSSESVVVMDEPLTTGNLQRLVDSPVRRELARRLVSGESVVWLLLESGNPAKDDAVEKRLRAQLDQLEDKIKLPLLEPEDMRNFELQQDSLRIEFSILRFSRNDPAETLLIATLLHSEPDLDASSQGPIAFPVFGRGRKLASFAGDQITVDNISRATRFITESCSCEIKESNPGMDLLVPIDWDKYIDNLIGFDESLPPLTGYARFIPPDTTACPAKMPETEPAQTASNLLLRSLLVTGVALVLVLGLLTGIVLRKKGNGNKE